MQQQPDWLLNIGAHEKRVYSQLGQDGILEYIFQHIGQGKKHCVEFGFNSPGLVGGSGANVANLVLNKKWTCLLLDGEYANPSINLHREFLTSKNLCDVLAKYNTPIDVDYVSIDVDSTDLWLFDSLLQKYKPRVVSVEYNSNIPLDYAITFPNDSGLTWGADCVYGASLKALNLVAEKYGYVLVYVLTYLDAFFIRKDLIEPHVHIPPLSSFRASTGIRAHGYCVSGKDQRLIDYEVYLKTNNAEQARQAANPICKRYLQAPPPPPPSQPRSGARMLVRHRRARR